MTVQKEEYSNSTGLIERFTTRTKARAKSAHVKLMEVEDKISRQKYLSSYTYWNKSRAARTGKTIVTICCPEVAWVKSAVNLARGKKLMQIR